MISVVVCAKNEAARIEDCLTALLACGDVDELIVVVGTSTDDTDGIARRFLCGAPLRFCVVTSDAGSLPADRQVGADLASGDWIVFIDADHDVWPGDIPALVADIETHGWAIAQAQLTVKPDSFWNRAESSFLALTHTPGERQMVGVAPAAFHRGLFNLLRFAESGAIDDTDLLYRLARDTDLRVGIGSATIQIRHAPRWRDYVAKWRWYGVGDKQFMAAHPERARSMRYHLLVRYPLVYPLRAIVSGQWLAAPYAVAQGVTRYLASRHR